MSEQNKKTLILIDGHSLAFRVYYGLERTGMSTSDKTPTWAVYGFINAIFRLLQKIQPDAIAMSFDTGRETFRTQMYPEYKANRESMPEEMRSQMGLIRESVEKLGIPIYELKNYEADDVIGTLSKQARDEGYYVQILTGDQDAFQLVEDDKVEVLIPPRTPKDQMKLYNREAVFTKMGVYPEQVIDFKGLKGDASDNIPGVRGVGDKTASKLLAEYQTLENLYAHTDDIKGKLQEKLVENRDIAFLSKELATIDRSSPIQAEFDHCHLSIPDVQAFLDFLERLEFRNFKKQAPELLKPFLNGSALEMAPFQESESNGTTSAVDLNDSSDDCSSSSIPYTLITQTIQLEVLVRELKQARVFALDIETSGLDYLNDRLVGISMAYYPDKPWQMESRKAVNHLGLKDYPASFQALTLKSKGVFQTNPPQTVYIPVGHEVDVEHQLDVKEVLSALRPLLEDPAVVKIAHNAKFEMNFFKTDGIEWQGLVYDTMIASYVHEADRRHGLKVLGRDVLGIEMQDIKTLIGSGKKEIPFSQVPLKEGADYGACDAYVTLKLAAYFVEHMDMDRETLLYEVELPVVHVLAEMERDGVNLDVPYLKNFSEELGEKLDAIEKDIYKLAGLEFNINSPKQVGDVLFEHLGIAPLRKTKSKSGYSTDAKVLEKLSEEHAVVQRILDYRQLFKLKSTYIDSLPNMVNPKTGRIHTSFNQTIAATGRLSSSEPNLQNIPIRTEEGRKIRAAFIPRNEGEVLLSADYSQIELRMLAHTSEDPNLLEAFNRGEDIHTATAALVFGMPVDKVTKEQRYKAKAVNFGVIYGQTAHGLSQQLRIPRAEAMAFIDRYFRQYSHVKMIIEAVQELARETGYVTTICGRVRNLDEGLNSSNKSIREFSERAAFNTVLQGSAADLMKVAMIRVMRMLKAKQLKSRMILQVHDELVLGVPEGELVEVKQLVKEAMELDQPLRVPLVVDIEVGKNWMDQQADSL